MERTIHRRVTSTYDSHTRLGNTLINEETNVRKLKLFEKREDTFLEILSGVNQAVQLFICAFESRHSATILNHELQNETSASMHYTAGIVRLNFTFQSSGEHFESSIIMKVPKLGVFWDLAQGQSLYAREKYMYETVFPLMYESWEQKKVVPNFYAATDLGELVMDNLKEYKFYQKKSGSLVDLKTCIVVLRSLAQFHALSLRHLAGIQQDLSPIKITERGRNEWEVRIYPAIVNKLKTHVLPFSSNRTREAFDSYLARIEEGRIRDLAKHENVFNVLLHGDLHFSNICYRDDFEGSVKECRFIDFQMSRVGCPIVDMMTFLVTSLSPANFELHQRVLFNSYLSAFQSTLDEVDPGRDCLYTMEQLMSDFEKCKLCLIYPLTCLTPLFWVGECDLRLVENNTDLDSVLKSAKYRSFFNGWAQHLLS